MKAEIRRYRPGGASGDPVTRLVIPARQLIIGSRGHEVRRGRITSGTVLLEFEIKQDEVARYEQIVAIQEIQDNRFRRRHRRAWALMNV